MAVLAVGDARSRLAPGRAARHITDAVAAEDLAGAAVCVVVPDATRKCPLPELLAAVLAGLGDRPRSTTVVVALGTHPPMTVPALARLTGPVPAGVEVVNHAWWDPDQLTLLATLDADVVAEVSGGRLAVAVPVRVNRRVADADVTIVVGPVLPHEVVGFSGGNKYLFPGVSGPEMIDASHWLGALLTSTAIIGRPGVTPVRALINRAAALVPGRRLAVCVVTDPGGDGLHAVAVGDPGEAWAAAVTVAADTHVRRLRRPVDRVLSVVSERYDELWTAAKGIYKVDPVAADGATVVLYAPHLRTVSATHGEAIASVGYHCRDYFTGQWGRYAHLPWGVLAHSTHVRGSGTWDPVAGERCRTTVALATGIGRAETEALGLAWIDPDSIDPATWAADPATLVVPDAGETLYRLVGD